MRVLVKNPQDDFRVKAYAGTNGVLLAMDLAEPRRKGLLGFAIEKQQGSKPWLFLFNSLTFPGKAHTFAQYHATPSDKAPLQKFRWADYAVNPGTTMHYRVHLAYGTADAPQLAIDSSALGGMYAGAIRLVGTEAGVGVKLAGDMAASAGDIQIDANGQLSMARTAASRDLQLKAENIELNADTFAGRNAVVDASGQTLVKESLAATQQLTVKGGELLNQGVVEAGVRADGSLNNTATLSLQTNTVTNPGTITSHGNLNSDVQTLDNRAGKLLSAGDATLNAQTLDNQGGRIVAQKDLELSGNQLNNQSGEVLAQQTIKVTAANLDNQDGTVAGDALDLPNRQLAERFELAAVLQLGDEEKHFEARVAPSIDDQVVTIVRDISSRSANPPL